MKDEYDFSLAERGRFYSPGAVFHKPIFLNPEIESFVEAIAARKNSDVSTVVNMLLEKEREIVEAVIA